MQKETIFLIKADDDARPTFRKELKNFGYQVSLAVDEEDALERVGQGNLQVDLMLINIPTKTTTEILKTARNISEKGRLNIPIVVMAANFGADLEGQDVQVSEKDYVTYLEEPDQLANLLSKLLPLSAHRVRDALT